MRIAIRNAKKIITPDPVGESDPMPELLELEGKDVIINDGMIEELHGSKPSHFNSGDFRILDAQGGSITPGFIDSHTHIMYCGDRTEEFYLKIAGSSYEDILKRGGGIFSTVKATRACSPNDLISSTLRRVENAMRRGTTTLEIKTGYGLDRDSEMRMLRSIEEVRRMAGISIISTALPLHAIPPGREEEDYVSEVLEEILPLMLDTSDFVDIFCDSGAFSARSAERLASFAKLRGVKMKMHAGEIGNIGCAKLCSRYPLTSVDHLIHTDAGDLRALSQSGAVATLLPITAFTLGEGYADFHSFASAGIPVAIATDSSPLTMNQNMLFAMNLAVRFLHMKPEEAFVASTVNAARALDMGNMTGIISEGKRADLLVLDIESVDEIPYKWDLDLVDMNLARGKLVFRYRDNDSQR